MSARCRTRPGRVLPAIAALVAAAALAGCAGLSGVPRHAGVRVVAAEATWGTVAARLAGPAVRVTSIIASPAVDPHSYEPQTADARAVAEADLVITNGLGYDTWMSGLVAADGRAGQVRLNVGALLGLAGGANPHRWYDPADVTRVADAITAALIARDPGGATGFRARRRAFLDHDLGRYFALIADIRRRDAGVPIGASESVAAPMAQALGLRLITPSALLRAVSDGADVSAADMATAEQQIRSRAIRVWVLNPQNSTPNVQILTGLARAQGIPVVTMTETPDPAGAGFAAWQTRQLAALAAALPGGRR